MIIKISHPWYNNNGSDPIIRQTSKSLGIWDNIKFEINNNCTECDYWLIAEDIPSIQLQKVRTKGCILITTEEVSIKTYDRNYLNQFDLIITSRADINGRNVIKSHYLNWWFIGKNYDELLETTFEKSKDISIISSNLTTTEGHKLRFAFVNKLIGHFKDKIDVYGKGFNYVEDKFYAIAPYKYSIAIENSSIKDYFTEKLVDCYLCNTYPIYYGAPNIENYFKNDTLLKLNILDYKDSINKIEELLASTTYEAKLNSIVEQKNLILNKLQFFPTVSDILSKYDANSANKLFTSRILKPQNTFKNINIYKKQIVKLYKKIVG